MRPPRRGGGCLSALGAMRHRRYLLKVRFDWDDRKAWANRAKHGISFEEAITAFDDHQRAACQPAGAQAL
jgi:hypothetical protein